MRVTIEHREATGGVMQNRKESYIDCTVQFSEEERAIIQARDLYREGFIVRTSTPLPSQGSTLGTGLMRGFGPLLIVGGLLYGMIVEGLAHAPTNFGAPVLFLGIGLTVFGFLRSRKEDKRFESDEQHVTVKRLLNNPSFTVHAWNPAIAKNLDEEIRGHLAALKNVIQNSAQIRAKQTFEL
jgi:hypothetical protein